MNESGRDRNSDASKGQWIFNSENCTGFKREDTTTSTCSKAKFPIIRK
ncbi:21904_t:CDS:2 [Cetraspora pellucida]|uniref:21904_t:CDS:1 n=1 Tax=Cetraspora pellucida TaxID=1433469 RepID=A0A9N9FIC3_9GLOM|nr:21904_t:CDS:2 [Cetraspora pellucida]